MIALTFDIDWAPDAIVRDVVSVLDEVGVAGTLFCTDYESDKSGQSSNIAKFADPRHELALHPNFQHSADYSLQWKRILGLYPQARGWRSHNGVTGWPIVSEGVSHGLRYEVMSSVFSDYITPCEVNGALSGYVALTTAFWDSHRIHDRSFSWRAADLPHRSLFSAPDKIVVLGFHPNILYYDLRDAAEYDHRKPTYHQPDETASHRHKELRGAMRLLRDLLASEPARNFTTVSAFGTKTGMW